jgi:hypothetical protein
VRGEHGNQENASVIRRKISFKDYKGFQEFEESREEVLNQICKRRKESSNQEIQTTAKGATRKRSGRKGKAENVQTRNFVSR